MIEILGLSFVGVLAAGASVEVDPVLAVSNVPAGAAVFGVEQPLTVAKMQAAEKISANNLRVNLLEYIA